MKPAEAQMKLSRIWTCKTRVNSLNAIKILANPFNAIKI